MLILRLRNGELLPAWSTVEVNGLERQYVSGKCGEVYVEFLKQKSNLAFGAYDSVSNTVLNSVGNVDFYCNGNTSVVLKLSLGNGPGASFYGGRRMRASGGNLLIYNIYTDSSHRHVLGDGTGGSVTLPVQGKFGFSRAIYGSIPANQRGLSASSYSDLLVITIVY